MLWNGRCGGRPGAVYSLYVHVNQLGQGIPFFRGGGSYPLLSLYSDVRICISPFSMLQASSSLHAYCAGLSRECDICILYYLYIYFLPNDILVNKDYYLSFPFRDSETLYRHILQDVLDPAWSLSSRHLVERSLWRGNVEMSCYTTDN